MLHLLASRLRQVVQEGAWPLNCDGYYSFISYYERPGKCHNHYEASFTSAIPLTLVHRLLPTQAKVSYALVYLVKRPTVKLRLMLLEENTN